MKNNWQTKKFEGCIDDVAYTTKIQRKNFLNDGEYPVVSQEEDLINGYWDKASDLFRINRPVIIFGDHTKVLKYVDFDFVLGADGVKILRPKEFLVPRFFYYQLQSVHLDSLGYARHYKLLKELEIKYPEISEQQRIVNILDKIFEKISKAKENAEKNLQNARELFNSYLQSVFANPVDGWEQKKLGEIIKLEYGKPLPDSKRQSNGMYPVYGANGEKDRTNEFYYDKYSIIVGRKGSAGEITLTEEKFWPLDVTYFVTYDQKKHYLNFIYYLLINLKLPKLAKGVKPGINRNEVHSVDVHIPLLSEQKRIVTKLDALSTETKKLEATYQQKLVDLEELKKSILQKAFNGELVGV